MFHTKNINYKMLSKDSLDAVRKFVTTEKHLFDMGISYLPHKPKNQSHRWKPYTNLLRPITNYLKEKDLNITIIGSNRIEGNTKRNSFKVPNKVNGSNTTIFIPLFDYSREQKILHFANTNCALNSTLMLVPLFDYSRTEKIYEYEFNKSVALNSTTCVKTGSFRSINNPYNTKFCYILYMLKQPIDIVEQRMQ